MSNSIVSSYRSMVPNDPRSDQELTIAFGRQNEIDGRYKDYPDLVSDYNALKNPQPEPSPFPPPVSAEFRQGMESGARSLKSSYLGMGALAADSIGANKLASALRQKYDESQAQESANPPTVGKVEDIHSFEDAARFGLRKAGEFVPNVAEALGFSAAGAAVGSAVGPEGTAVGAGGGLLEGFLGRQAAKSVLKTLVEKGAEKLGLDESAAAVVKSQLEKVAAGEAVPAFDKSAGTLLQQELKSKASKLGMEAANFANFGALGAGGEYPAAIKAGADKEDATTAAAIAGLGSSMGALLPNFAFGKFFPGVSEGTAKTYVARLAVDAAKEIPMASSGMGLMEVANIAAERYADPSKRDQPLTDDEKSRILNAAVVGGMMGAAAAPVSAIPGAKGEVAKPQTFDPAVEQHFADVPQERRDQIAELKGRIEGKQGTEADMAAVRSLTPQEKNFYAVAKAPELPREEPAATAVPAESSAPEAEAAATSPPTTPTKSAEAQPSGLVSTPVTTADKQEQDLQAKRAAAVVTTAPSKPMAEATKARVEAAAKQTDPNPSLAQKLAGNYQKGHVDGADVGIPGIQIAIENPAGTERVDTGGKWQVTMPDHYGQILGTKGKDGDPIDIHIGPNPSAPTVFVVDQVNPKTGAFDEHKTFLGFESQVQAEAAYDAGFSDGSGPSRRGAVTAMDKGQFREWLKDDKATKEPLKYKESSGALKADAKTEGSVTRVRYFDKSGAEVGYGQTDGKVINYVEVKPEFRGKGIGPDIVKDLRSRGGEIGITTSPESRRIMQKAGALEYAPDHWSFDKATKEPLKYKEPQPKVSVPLMVTKEMEQSLADLGYPREERNKLKPEEAHSIIEKGVRYANREPSPVEAVRSEAPQSAAQVAEGKPGEVQRPTEAQTQTGNAPAGGDETVLKTQASAPIKEPEVPKATLERKAKIAAKEQELAGIKAKLAEIRAKKSAEELAARAKAGKESGFILNPADLIKALGWSKEEFELHRDAAKALFDVGILKFKDFAAELVDQLGHEAATAAGALYQSIREYFRSVMEDKRATPEAKDEAREKLGKMTPENEMADETIKLHEKVHGKQTAPEVYDVGHRINPEDVDIQRRGTRDVSARGRDSALAGELWNQMREKENRGKLDRLFKNRLKDPGIKDLDPALSSWEYLNDLKLPTGRNVGKDIKDVFISSLPKKVQDQIRAQEGEPIEPAFFVPEGTKRRGETQNEFTERLTNQLVSDASPPSSDYRNTMTHRLVDIRDNDTGEIHRVSVFENNGEARVTKSLNPELGRNRDGDRSISLKNVLEANGKDGKPRYQAVGSVRTKGLTEYYHEVFPNQKHYRDSFAKQVTEDQKAVVSGGRAEQVKMEAAGREQGAAAKAAAEEGKEEGMVEEPEEARAGAGAPQRAAESIEESQEDKTEGGGAEVSHEQAIEKPINLEPNEVKLLRDSLPHFDTLDELTEMLASPELIPDDLYQLMERVANDNVYFFTEVADSGLEKALDTYGYDAETGNRKQDQQGAAREEKAGVQNPERGGGQGPGGPEAGVASGENPAGAAGQTGGGGNEEPANAAGGGAGEAGQGAVEGEHGQPEAGALKQTTPEQRQEPHNPEAEQLVNSIHEAAARAGIDVLDSTGEIRKGAYDPKTRTLYQVIGDTVGSQDVKTAFHEVGHDVFANEPADVRGRLLSGIDRLSDEALGVDTSADTRIRASDPAGLGKEAVNEERLVESTAEKLTKEGFSPEEAKGYAQKFVRALKDFYYKAAMKVQEWLGFDPNPKLAQRYFENRVKQLLAGDRQGISYVDFVGAGKDATGKRYADVYQGSKTLGERLSSSGDLEYDHAPDDSLAASRFNLDAITGVKWNLPEEEFPKETRQVEIEKRAAVLNHRRDSITLAGKALEENPQLGETIAKFKGGTDAYVRRLLNISDPEEAKKLLAQDKERGGEAVPYDAEKKIDGFKHKAETDAVTKSAYQNAQSLLSKIGEARTKATDGIEELQKHIEQRQGRLESATDRLNEVLATKEDKTKVVQGIDKLEKKFKGQVAQAKRDIKAANKQIDALKLKVTALDTAFPVLYKEQAKLANKLEISAPFVLRDQAVINVPEKADASNADIVKSKKTLHLDSSGVLTNPLEVEEHLRKMNAWLKDREAKAQAGDEAALDNVYHAVKRQFEEVTAHKDFRVDVMPAHRWMSALGLMPVGRRMAEAFGTPAARFIDKMINHYNTVMESMHPFNERIGRRNDQLENDLLKMTPGMDRDYLRDNVLDKAKRKAQDQHDLEEAYANDPNKLRRAIMSRIKDTLLADKATGKHIGPVVDRYMPALEKLLQHQHEANQWQMKHVETGRTGVLDPSLKAFNPATGKVETAVRRAVPVGAFTFSQKIHPETQTMIKAMRASDWASMGDKVDGLAEKYNEEGPDAARDLIDKQFNTAEHSDQVQRKFFRSLAEMDTNSPFFAPGEETGEEGEGGGANIRQPADPAKVKEAFEEAGANDPIGFAEKLHDLYGAPGDRGQFVQDTIGRMASIYKEIDDVYRSFEPSDKAERTVAIRGMTPDAMIDARKIEHLPSEWFSYHSFDQKDMFNTSQRIASQTAFGRGQERLGSAFDTVKSEVESAVTRLDEARQAVKEANPEANPKEFEKLMTDRLGKDQYEKLQQQADRSKLLMSSVRGLSDFFRKDNSPDGTLNAMTKFAHALGSLLVNQPASAINQMEQLFALNLKYGASGSTLGATAKVLGTMGKEAAHSLAGAIGIQLRNEGEFQQLRTELGLGDPTVMKNWHDAFDRLQGESRLSQFWRGLDDLMGVGVNRVGEKAQHVVFRPLQPFTWAAMLGDRAVTDGVWQMAKTHLGRGLDFYKANPEKLEDNTLKLDSKGLGLKGQDKDTFDRFTSDMERWGLNYDSMVRNALQRDDGKAFTNDDALKLYSMAVSEVMSESNLSTMAPGAYNNSILRVVTPLLGWSFRRAQQVAQLGLNEEGKRDMVKLGRAMAGLTVMAGGGLAVSALVNQYSENLLGKKRNLRPLVGPDAKETALGIMENLNRVGTLGLFGELLNGAVNVGTGQDNRIISIDQRVVAVNALMSIQSAISSFVNQGFEADYAHVVRPLASSLGAGGMLQYMQLANHTLGLDNPESRMVARSNAQNWLRAVGRDLNMDVRESGGGGGMSNATPMSPALTRMELAAYGNSPSDFQQAYHEAIKAAKDAGNPDPVDYVKRAYAARNPLRQVFRTSPSEAEYKRILAALPENGRRDVDQAVDFYNEYAEQIGARPFEGKPEKPAGHIMGAKFGLPKLMQNQKRNAALAGMLP